MRVGAAALLALFVAGAAPAAAGPRVVFTFDVESNAYYPLPQQLDAVCNDGRPCGLAEMVRMLNDRKWPGTFFLNVYEHQRFGDAFMRALALRLQNAGNDVALHTHPDAYDPARPEMYEYSLDEQTAIVRDGVQLLQGWTGLPVVSHRAGAYSADANTLIALARNGIRNDSSLFWDYPKSKLNALAIPKNVPSLQGQVTEIPVTAYQREDHPGGLGWLLAPVTSARKIDGNWLIDAAEMRAAIDAAIDHGFPVIVVFLHSFSFMQAGSGAPAADRHAMEMFEATLDYVAQQHLPVTTMRELAAGEVVDPRVADAVPRIGVNVDVAHYAWRRVKEADGRSRAAAAGLLGVALLAAIVGLVRHRRAVMLAPAVHGSAEGP
jgi:peptidoglycan/xylan/chitin deacetylase (PgdA/CDA1 family)